jgi:hypothetical protein
MRWKACFAIEVLGEKRCRETNLKRAQGGRREVEGRVRPSTWAVESAGDSVKVEDEKKKKSLRQRMKDWGSRADGYSGNREESARMACTCRAAKESD